jgi:diaminobutyrate-2-oxoglutarate transaminase
VEFARGVGHYLYDIAGNKYLDFLAGAGALNYGHNDPDMKQALADYILSDGIAMGLDFYFEAKTNFIKAFDELILKPRKLAYKLQFVGPTGTNAVEAAIKLARKVTGRANIVSFTNGYHGCTLGSLAATGNVNYRTGSQGALSQVYRALYDNYIDGVDTADVLDRMMSDPSAGFDNVAGIILEGIQGEGGLSTASPGWARKIQAIAHKHGAVLILDEVQTGCGRSGTFFSFEGLGIRPDIVTMAKSISGFGLPMAIALIRPDLDIWLPGEHTGTFRGNAHALVTATVALRKFWSNSQLSDHVKRSETHVAERLGRLAVRHGLLRKGRGMMQGLRLLDGEMAAEVQSLCLERGMLIENCGPYGEVMKIFAALTIPPDALDEGLSIFEDAVDQALARRSASLIGSASVRYA